MKQVNRPYSARPWSLWVVPIALVFLLLFGLLVQAQTPAAPNSDATLETWRTYATNVATKANAAAATLTPARKNEARSLFATAFDLANGGNLDAAKIAFERGLAIDPSNAAAEYYLAETLVKMKQVNDALPHYATSMGLAPNAKEGIQAEAALRKVLSTIIAVRAAAQAKAQAAETALWQSARGNDSIQAYRAYLTQYPRGIYATLANSRIEALSQEAQLKQQALLEEQSRAAAEARRQEAKQAAVKAENDARAAEIAEAIKKSQEQQADMRARRSLKCTGTFFTELPGLFGRKEIPSEGFKETYIWDPTGRALNGHAANVLGDVITTSYDAIIDSNRKVLTRGSETINLATLEISARGEDGAGHLSYRFEGRCTSEPLFPGLQQ
jgi:tetratricopeptide (TPR) repeat protein